jgi:hypothetical protein
VYGPVRTVVWQGSAGDRRPYADHHALTDRFAVLLILFRLLFEPREGELALKRQEQVSRHRFTSSTRLFFARPSSVLLSAMGLP